MLETSEQIRPDKQVESPPVQREIYPGLQFFAGLLPQEDGFGPVEFGGRIIEPPLQITGMYIVRTIRSAPAFNQESRHPLQVCFVPVWSWELHR
jgi:hypothetical protein